MRLYDKFCKKIDMNAGLFPSIPSHVLTFSLCSTHQNHPNFEILTPPYLLTAAGGPATRPIIRSVSNPTTFSPGGTIQVTMDTSGSHTFSLIRTGVATHATNLDQRRIPLTVSSQVGGVFTLRVPSRPAHVPPGIYWMFAMNGAGVPSVGYSLTRPVL
jgi:galactose oxidase